MCLMLPLSHLRQIRIARAANLGSNSSAFVASPIGIGRLAAIALPLAEGLFMLKGSPSRMQRLRPCPIAPSVSAGVA